MTPPRRAFTLRVLTAAVVALPGIAAVVAHAQTPPSGGLPPDLRLPANIQALILGQNRGVIPRSKVPPPHLTPQQSAKLQEARNLHASGMLDGARDVLVALDKNVPHHALVLTELARVQLDKSDYAGVVKLANAERAALRDSLLLGRELAQAEERLGRPRDAVTTVLEAWVASPDEAEWAAETIARLGIADPRGAMETTRAVTRKFPERRDLEVALARLSWQAGDADGAVRALASADLSGQQPAWRWRFADELLASGSTRDSTGAIEALLSLAGDRGRARPERIGSARRGWQLAEHRGATATLAPRFSAALADVPHAQWDPTMLVAVARALREGGHTAESRALLGSHDDAAPAVPGVTLERALADLRDGPPERALPALERASHGGGEAMFRFAEALFYAGQADSALGRYQEASKLTDTPWSGAALERIYLIEDADPKTALPAFGRMMYEDWRGNRAPAAAIAESLYRALPHGPLWAQAAIALSAYREAAGKPDAALLPVLAVADSLPEDRTASLARQRAGDLYLVLKDDKKALAEYEECLARYPRAWNSAEVRRHVEALRREGRF